jgi:hypothetical protein
MEVSDQLEVYIPYAAHPLTPAELTNDDRLSTDL